MHDDVGCCKIVSLRKVAPAALDVVLEAAEGRVVRRPGVCALGVLSDLLEGAGRHLRPPAHQPPDRLVVRAARGDDRALARIRRVVASLTIAAHRWHLQRRCHRHRNQLAHLRVGGGYQPDRADQPGLFHQPASQRRLGDGRVPRAASHAAVGVGGARRGLASYISPCRWVRCRGSRCPWRRRSPSTR